jgi:hypothetical protein
VSINEKLAELCVCRRDSGGLTEEQRSDELIRRRSVMRSLQYLTDVLGVRS